MFDSEMLLAMDYRVLRRYTEEALIEKPDLFGMMKNINRKGEGGPEHDVRDYLAKKRCISAFIGVRDPLNNKRRMVR